MIDDVLPPAGEFPVHRVRGAFNAAFFSLMSGYLDRAMRAQKLDVLSELPGTVVEIGSGVGANLAYLSQGSTLVAVEPNPAMHRRLRAAAVARGIDLDLRVRSAQDTGLPTASADCVISSLVLCSVSDPRAVMAEIRRVLRPGGTFRFVEHVGARPRSPTRLVQRALRRPWAWTFEGCSCERDLAYVVDAAGFARVDVRSYRLRSPVVPFNTQIAGIAYA